MGDVLDQFSNVLSAFVYRSAYTPGQLSSLSGVPKNTIINWLNGRVQRPRSWKRIVALATAMRLTEAEADQLLTAAQQPPIATLRQETTAEETTHLFTFWEDLSSHQPPAHAPFQAIPLAPYFVGREDLLSKLENLLCQPKHATLYCVYGMGGVGKTAVAAQLAYRLQTHFPDGVLWARVDHSDTMSILASFAEAYQQDVSHYHDIASRSRVVRGLLRGKRVLLVLDNVQTSEELVPLLPSTGQCAVLVTTRRQDLSALVGAKRFELQPFTADVSASLNLFHHILGEDRFTAVEDALLAKIATDLGHLPLALVIAASRLAYEPHWDLAQFQERLQHVPQSMRLLRYESQSVQQSFQMSYDLLPTNEARVLDMAGWLNKQDFSLDVITQLTQLDTDTTADCLRRLSTLSLLETRDAGRYSLHPLVHDFVRGISSKQDYLPLVCAFWPHFVADNRQRFDRLAAELGHIDEVVSHMLEAKKARPLRDFLDDLLPSLIATGDYLRAERYLQEAQALFASMQDAALLCWLRWARGHLARHRQQLEQAYAFLQEGLVEADGLSEQTLIPRFLTELGIVCNCQGDYEHGRSYLTRALSIARHEPLSETMLDLLEELGVSSLMEGDQIEAERYYVEGLQSASRLGYDMHKVLFLKSVGAVHHLREQRPEARDLFQRGLVLAEQIDFRRGRMLLHNNIAVCAFFEGNLADADRYLQMALQEAEQLHNFQGVGLILNNLARLARHNGRVEPARDYFRRLRILAQTHKWESTEKSATQELDRLMMPLQPDRPAEHLRVFI